MNKKTSLEQIVRPYIKKPYDRLPDAIKDLGKSHKPIDPDQHPKDRPRRVAIPIFLSVWNNLSPTQRMEAARQWDLNNDPSPGKAAARAFALQAEISEIGDKIRTWTLVAAPKAGQLAEKEKNLSKLKAEAQKKEVELAHLCGGGPRRAATPADVADFKAFAEQMYKATGNGPSPLEAEQFASGRNIGREWGRDQRKLLHEKYKRKRGEHRRS